MADRRISILARKEKKVRIVFENGEILECEHVAKIFLDKADEAYVRSGLDYILKEEYGRGFKDGYKTGVVDYKTKMSAAPDIMES